MTKDDKITATLWVPTALPGLNELLALKSKDKGSYDRAKKAAHAVVAPAIFEASLPSFIKGAYLSYVLVEKNRRRDPGNVFAGASKLIEDSLVTCRVLTTDGWKGVLGYR